MIEMVELNVHCVVLSVRVRVVGVFFIALVGIIAQTIVRC